MLADKLFLIGIVHFLIYSVQTKEKSKKEIGLEEDLFFFKTSIIQFGAPQSYEKFELPGPQIVTGGEDKIENVFMHQGENVTYKYRSISKYFSYNEFYENVKSWTRGPKQIREIKGQVTEKISRINGGHYLRTVGYVYDRNGFRIFLIDISKVETTKIRKPQVTLRSGESYYNIPRTRISQRVPTNFAGGGLG